MIGTLDELLVVSDIDNTLLNAVEGLPEVNRATIQLFSSLGGRFTVPQGVRWNLSGATWAMLPSVPR